MFNNPFRPDALASRNQRQQLDHLLRITAPHERIVLLVVGLILLGLVVWAFLGSVRSGVAAAGLLLEPGDRYEVVSVDSGRLLEYLVGPGDVVEEGDAIARQSVPELDREVAVLRSRIDLMESEFAEGGVDERNLGALLALARVALLQAQTRHATRELIVSHIDGEVMALRSTRGAYLPAGEAVAQLRSSGEPALEAVLLLPPRMAQRLEPGMPAGVEVVTPEGGTRRLHGRVDGVTPPGAVPPWLAALQPDVPDQAHRVDVVLTEAEVAFADGTPCRVSIQIDRRPAAVLLDLVRS